MKTFGNSFLGQIWPDHDGTIRVPSLIKLSTLTRLCGLGCKKIKLWTTTATWFIRIANFVGSHRQSSVHASNERPLHCTFQQPSGRSVASTNDLGGAVCSRPWTSVKWLVYDRAGSCYFHKQSSRQTLLSLILKSTSIRDNQQLPIQKYYPWSTHDPYRWTV